MPARPHIGGFSQCGFFGFNLGVFALMADIRLNTINPSLQIIEKLSKFDGTKLDLARRSPAKTRQLN